MRGAGEATKSLRTIPKGSKVALQEEARHTVTRVSPLEDQEEVNKFAETVSKSLEWVTSIGYPLYSVARVDALCLLLMTKYPSRL